jgi:hypothetical protein
MNELKRFHDLFFSPLGKEWCLYYYILLVIAFLGFVMTVFAALSSVFSAKKFTAAGFVKNTLAPILTSLIVYFLSRLTYSICAGALH